MAFTRPTLSQTFEDAKADLLARFPTLDPSLPNSMALAIAAVTAGGVSGTYDYLDWIMLQVFPDTATGENLERHGNIIGITRLAAAAATGNATVTGVIGSSVPTGAKLVSNGNVEFTVDTGFTLTASSEEHAVTAVVAAAESNQEAGAALTWSAAHIGMDATATVASGGLTGGRDRESDDDLRTAVLTRLGAPPKGGSKADYDLWAREGVGATRSFPRNWENGSIYGETIPVGEIKHYFAMDSTYADGIPLAGDVTTLQTYIDIVKPMGAVYTAVTPTAFPVDVDVTITPLTADTTAATESALEDAIREGGIVGGPLLLNALQEGMTSVPGLTTWDITSPTGSVTASTGALHTTGTITVT